MPGRIRPEDVEQIRERADLVEVISGHTQLKKAGRIFKGLCPFHQEKTPSFTVDPDRGLFHCFGCGAGGDVFTFVRDTESMSFVEAAERLAARYGVPLRFERDGGGPGDGRKLLQHANQAAAEFFADLLMRSGEATAARRHLEGRGFTSEDASSWGLGFSPPGRDLLLRHLLAKKFTAKQIVDAGLAIESEGGEYRDRFRGRLMFPIAEPTGELVGFGARALGDEHPKYLNSPETAVYHKAKILYGLDRARREMAAEKQAVVVEGYTDVIALHGTGVRTAVATCGTALGEDHLGLLKRFCDRVILAFDSDAAGAVASERAFGIHARLGLEVLVAPMPTGKDPADLALSEGAEGVRSALESAVPLMRWVLEAEIGRHRLDTPEGKAKAVRAAAGLLSWEPSRVARGEHAFWVARRIGVQEAAVMNEFSEASAPQSTAQQIPRTVRQPAHVKVEREALALLLDAAGEVEDPVNEDHFAVPEHRVLLRAVLDSKGQAGLLDRLPDDVTRRLAAELALMPRVTQDPQEVFHRLEEFRLRRQIAELRNTLDRLKPGDSEYENLFEQLMRLESERRREGD